MPSVALIQRIYGLHEAFTFMAIGWIEPVQLRLRVCRLNAHQHHTTFLVSITNFVSLCQCLLCHAIEFQCIAAAYMQVGGEIAFVLGFFGFEWMCPPYIDVGTWFTERFGLTVGAVMRQNPTLRPVPVRRSPWVF